MTAPSIRGYWTNVYGTYHWTVAPVAGDTIYVFTGPGQYDASVAYPPNGTNFPVVRSNGNYSHLAKRTATGTSTDNPSPAQNSIAIAVYGTDGERYAGNWQAASQNSYVGAIGSLNSGNPVGVDDLLVVVSTSASLGSPDSETTYYPDPSTISPTDLIRSAQSQFYVDFAGSGFYDLEQTTLLRKQLTSTTNPGSIQATEALESPAYGVFVQSDMAILIKGSSTPSGPTAYGPSIRR